MNTITIELSKEDRMLLEDVVGLLGRLVGEAGDIRNLIQGAAAPQPAPETATPETVHPVEEVSPHGTPEPAAEAAPAASQYTQADILAIVQRLIAPGSKKRAAAKAIVNDYAVKISAIPEDKYSEVMDRLIALEKEGV